MFLGLTILFVALAISGVSAYYSILGLTAIFAADPMPIIIMGAVLEAGKISTAVWLHHNWDRISLRFKFYMVPALVFLMMLTSMGVFGFLSKAHIDQGLPTATIQSKIDIINQQIKNKQVVIDGDQLQLKQLDTEVSQVMSRSNTVYGARLAGEIMRHQKNQRTSLTTEIASLQTDIIKLKEQEQPLIEQSSKISAEVGPIKYVAALIYGAKGDNPELLQSAVRWVIILIVVVFDPLALTLILAGTQQISWSKKEPRDDPKVQKLTEELDEYRGMVSKLEGELSESLEKHLELASRNSSLGFENKDVRELLDVRNKQVAELTAELNDTTAHTVEVIKEVIKEVPVEVVKEVIKEVPVEVVKEVIKEVPVEIVNEIVKEVPVVKEVSVVDHSAVETLKSQHATDLAVKDDIIGRLNSRITELEGRPQAVVPTPAAPVIKSSMFGLEFPETPERGMLFMRIDFRPTRLFKWNGVTWVGLNKNIATEFANNSAYLDLLIQKLDAGEYAANDLTPDELTQIRARGRSI